MSASRKAEFERLCDLVEDLTRGLEGLKRQLETFAADGDEQDTAGPRWISLKRAAKIFGYHPDTLKRWAVIYGLGHKLPGGRSAPWVVDEFAVREHLARREPIPS
jgi:hypothetical protein